MTNSSPTNTSSSPKQLWLIGFALVVVIVWLAAWLMPGFFVVPTTLGHIELYIPLTIIYVLMLSLIKLNIKTIHLVNLLLIVGIAICVFHIIAHLALSLPTHQAVWDDAFMFIRYIINIRQHSIIAWNVTDGAAYGATEFLYLWVVYGISLFTGMDAPHQTLQLGASLGGIIFLALIALMVWRIVRWHTTGKLWVLFLMMLGMVFHTPSFVIHFITGMGTTFVMCYLMIYLLLAHWFEQTLSRKSTVITGIWGGLAFYARPDLLIFSAIIPLVMWIFTKGNHKRRMAFQLGLITIGTIIAAMIFARLIMGSMLPLPFYVKSGSFYGGSAIYASFSGIPAAELDAFYVNNLFYLCALALGLLMPRRIFQRWGLVGWGAFIAGLAYIFYFRFFVLQVMGHFQRFYYPTLPALIYLTIAALVVLEYLPAIGLRLSRTAGIFGLVTIVVMGCLCVPMPFFDKLVSDFSPPKYLYEQPTDAEYSAYWSRYWAELAELIKIPCPINLATTEVGIPSVLRPDWYIYDLSGLNNPDIVFNGFSVERFLATKPDLIYMPKMEFYTEIAKKVKSHPSFETDYEFFYAVEVDGSFDMAVRRDSACYTTIHEILELARLRNKPPNRR